LAALVSPEAPEISPMVLCLQTLSMPRFTDASKFSLRTVPQDTVLEGNWPWLGSWV